MDGTTYSELGPSTSINQESRKCPTNFPTGQSDGGSPSTEIASSQLHPGSCQVDTVAPPLVIFTYTNTSLLINREESGHSHNQSKAKPKSSQKYKQLSV